MSTTLPELLKKVREYKMPAAAVELLNEHEPLILAGVTAAGKETIIEAIEKLGHGGKVVTHTTRHPRPGERNGEDYWFVTPARMLELVEEESFIEIKQVHDSVYGSGIAAYQTTVDRGLRPILRIDVQGIEEIRNHVSHLRPVFLLPPNFETWMERLTGRGQMSYVDRQRRFQSAKIELQRALSSEHFMLVVNHTIQQAAKEVVDGQTDPFAQRAAREVAQKLIDHMNAY